MGDTPNLSFQTKYEFKNSGVGHIPIICAYVDLISIHLMLRIVVIGTYLRKTKELLLNQENIDYESFLWGIRKDRHGNPFMFELLALHRSSIAISFLVVVFGGLIAKTNPEGWVILGSGIGGMVFTFWAPLKT